jgi:predicted transcriptional regulator
MAGDPQTPLQEWMQKRGIKQSWLATEAGMKQPLISKFATGKTLPDIHQAQRIWRALRNVSPDVTIETLWPLED